MPKFSIIAHKVLELYNDLESFSLILCYTHDDYELADMISCFRNSQRNWSWNEERRRKDAKKLIKYEDPRSWTTERSVPPTHQDEKDIWGVMIGATRMPQKIRRRFLAYG